MSRAPFAVTTERLPPADSTAMTSVEGSTPSSGRKRQAAKQSSKRPVSGLRGPAGRSRIHLKRPRAGPPADSRGHRLVRRRRFGHEGATGQAEDNPPLFHPGYLEPGGIIEHIAAAGVGIAIFPRLRGLRFEVVEMLPALA